MPNRVTSQRFAPFRVTPSMKPSFRLLLLALASPALAQLTPTGPIENFNLPKFGPNGVKEWQLGGRSAVFGKDTSELPRKTIAIKELQIVTYDAPLTSDASPAARQTFTSPQATVYPDEQRALSEDSLKLVGPGYTLTGKKWSWERKNGTNRIEIKSSARLVIGFDLSGSLIPATQLAPTNENPLVPPAREGQ